MTTRYAAERASAGADIAAAGQPVTFTRTAIAYTAGTDQATPTTTTATGAAIRVRPRFIDIQRIQAPGLTIVDPVTLLVAAEGMAFDPQPGDTFVWAGVTYAVRSTEPTGPDGVTIVTKIVASR